MKCQCVSCISPSWPERSRHVWQGRPMESVRTVAGKKDLPKELREKVFSHLNTSGKRAVASASKNLRNNMKPLVDSIKASSAGRCIRWYVADARGHDADVRKGNRTQRLVIGWWPKVRVDAELISPYGGQRYKALTRVFVYVFDTGKEIPRKFGIGPIEFDSIKRYLRYEFVTPYTTEKWGKPVDQKEFPDKKAFIDDIKKSYMCSMWNDDVFGDATVSVQSLTDNHVPMSSMPPLKRCFMNAWSLCWQNRTCQ